VFRLFGLVLASTDRPGVAISELIRENKRLMDRSTRELEREITKLKQDEKKVRAPSRCHLGASSPF